MPSTNYTNLITLINAKIRNYAVEAFHDMALNQILLLFAQWIESGGTTGVVTSPTVTIVTSANFTTAKDCPIPALAGQNIAVFWIDPPKPLVKGTDWTDYVGGGFTMSDPLFDASSATFTFWVFITS